MVHFILSIISQKASPVFWNITKQKALNILIISNWSFNLFLIIFVWQVYTKYILICYQIAYTSISGVQKIFIAIMSFCSFMCHIHSGCRHLWLSIISCSSWPLIFLLPLLNFFLPSVYSSLLDKLCVAFHCSPFFFSINLSQARQ